LQSRKGVAIRLYLDAPVLLLWQSELAPMRGSRDNNNKLKLAAFSPLYSVGNTSTLLPESRSEKLALDVRLLILNI
jgi:hypothetical protein